MTPSEMHEKFIRQIELEYNGSYIDSDRKALKILLQLRVRPEDAALSFAMFAVKQWASKTKGLPDCAVIRQALDKYESEYQSSLKPITVEFNDGIPALDKEDDREKTPESRNIYKKAEKMGIDWHEEGWMLQYFNKLIEGKQARGGVIHGFADLDNVKPFFADLPDFGEREPKRDKAATWETLGTR